VVFCHALGKAKKSHTNGLALDNSEAIGRTELEKKKQRGCQCRRPLTKGSCVTKRRNTIKGKWYSPVHRGLKEEREGYLRKLLKNRRGRKRKGELLGKQRKTMGTSFLKVSPGRSCTKAKKTKKRNAVPSRESLGYGIKKFSDDYVKRSYRELVATSRKEKEVYPGEGKSHRGFPDAEVRPPTFVEAEEGKDEGLY